MLILLKTCEFCIFWTFYRFRGGGAQKNAAAGRFTAAFCGLFFRGNRKRPRWGLSTEKEHLALYRTSFASPFTGLAARRPLQD